MKAKQTCMDMFGKVHLLVQKFAYNVNAKGNYCSMLKAPFLASKAVAAKG